MSDLIECCINKVLNISEIQYNVRFDTITTVKQYTVDNILVFLLLYFIHIFTVISYVKIYV